MVQEDRDVGDGHRVGRLAFGVVHTEYYQHHPDKPISWPDKSVSYPVSWRGDTPEPKPGDPGYYQHYTWASASQATYQNMATQGMRDNDRDAHPTLAGTGVYVKRNVGRWPKQCHLDYQELTY